MSWELGKIYKNIKYCNEAKYCDDRNMYIYILAMVCLII